MLLAILEAARPRQWVKNLFVALPLVFGKRLDDGPQALKAACAVALFCVLASAVYLWNDVVDLEKDRAHPTKRNRPVASGRLSASAAKTAASILAAGALVGGVFLSLDFALAAAGYLLLNVAYSLKLKRIVYMDVLSISSMFLLRVLGGALAIGVWASPYLLVCTGLVSCFFGFGKRSHELAAVGAGDTRAVLEHYRADVLHLALLVTGTATLAGYALYTRAEHTLSFFHTTKMIWTVPFAAFGLGRFGWLVTRREIADSPTDAMLRDWPFVLNLVLWAAAVTLIIYFHP